MAEETFKVDTEKEIEKEEDGIVLDTSTGKGLENMEIPESMRAPAFEGGRKVRIFMNEQYGFPHGIQITAGIANHKPQLVGKPSDVERHSIDEDDIVIEIGYASVAPDFSGFNDVVKGKEIALAQYESGADVIYHAAGGTGTGIVLTGQFVTDLTLD